MKLVLKLLCITLGWWLTGCSGGINPADFSHSAIISGEVRYVLGGGADHFPPLDSLRDLRVVGFKSIPRDTNVVQIVGNGDAFFSATILDSSLASTHSFSFEIPQDKLGDSTLVLNYIAVAQQYGPNFLSDWRVIGLYSLEKVNEPSAMIVTPGMRRTDVVINVDWHNLPPQPFKR